MPCCRDVEILNFLKKRKAKQRERERQRKVCSVLDRFKKQAASWSRRVVVFVDVIFAVSISNHPPPFFLQSFGQAGRREGGRAGRVGSRASSCDAAGGSAAPPQPLSVSPPLFSLARACNLLAFFLAGNLLYAVRRWRSCADARACSGAPKNERRGVFWLGVVYFKASDKT